MDAAKFDSHRSRVLHCPSPSSTLSLWVVGSTREIFSASFHIYIIEVDRSEWNSLKPSPNVTVAGSAYSARAGMATHRGKGQFRMPHSMKSIAGLLRRWEGCHMRTTITTPQTGPSLR
jgi:hypothetical protein